MKTTQSTIKSRYETLSESRRPFLERAWQASTLTIPSLLPREGHTDYTNLPTPWQAVGSRAVNELAARLLTIGFPANAPMFRMAINETIINQNDDEGLVEGIEGALFKFETVTQQAIEESGDRASIFEMIKHLVVVGNVLTHVGPLGLRVYTLNNYVVHRDPSGNPLEIIATEHINPIYLPESVRSSTGKKKGDRCDDESVELLTSIKRTEKNWEVVQEVDGVIIPDTKRTYSFENMPWLALRWTRIDGEDYGRSHVDSYLGDLQSIESLSRALVEGSQASAKLLMFVNPGGSTSAKDVEEAQNGSVLIGNAADVSVLQILKANDFSVAKDQLAVLSERIYQAFLVQQGARDAERVTAEEIRWIAQQIESSLSGFYSLFAQEFQLPYVKLKIARLQADKRLPHFQKGMATPTIITGVEAIGRGSERAKLIAFAQTVKEILGPETLRRINANEFIRRLALTDGIKLKGLMVPQEELSEQDQQGQMQQAMAKAGPAIVNQLGGVIKQRMGDVTAEKLNTQTEPIQS